MRWERNVSTPKIRPRFSFNYADYVISIQKVKRVEREVSIIPQKRKAIGVLSSRIGYSHLSLRALCFLRELRRVIQGE